MLRRTAIGATTMMHVGTTPDGAHDVVLHFGEREPVTIEVQHGRHYLAILESPPGGDFGMPDTIEVVDADGEVIASVQP